MTNTAQDRYETELQAAWREFEEQTAARKAGFPIEQVEEDLIEMLRRLRG
jgi:hypothetical protein